MREKMDAMQREFERFFDYIKVTPGNFALHRSTTARSRRARSGQPYQSISSGKTPHTTKSR
jgi:hypothetical protein